MKVKKAIFPVAGIGSRFLPATKSIPKEMLPIVDKPLIQYATDEALQAGIDNLIFITGKNKRAIEDYFDRDLELEERLKEQGKHQILEKVSAITPATAAFIYLRQYEPRGLGHAIFCAAPVINQQAFAVLLADDFIGHSDNPSVLQELVRIHEKHDCCVLAIKEVSKEKVGQYGVIEATPIDTDIFEVKDLIEKPDPDKAPSNFAVVGRYILTAEILDLLKETKEGISGEIQLTDAIKTYLMNGGRVLAYQFKAAHYDCGNKQGYLHANLHVAKNYPEIKIP